MSAAAEAFLAGLGRGLLERPLLGWASLLGGSFVAVHALCFASASLAALLFGAQPSEAALRRCNLFACALHLAAAAFTLTRPLPLPESGETAQVAGFGTVKRLTDAEAEQALAQLPSWNDDDGGGDEVLALLEEDRLDQDAPPRDAALRLAAIGGDAQESRYLPGRLSKDEAGLLFLLGADADDDDGGEALLILGTCATPAGNVRVVKKPVDATPGELAGLEEGGATQPAELVVRLGRASFAQWKVQMVVDDWSEAPPTHDLPAAQRLRPAARDLLPAWCTQRNGVALFSLITACFHLRAALAPSYFRGVLLLSRNPFRWLEYCVTSGLMMVLLTNALDLTKAATVLGIFLSTAVTNVCGYFCEQLAGDLPAQLYSTAAGYAIFLVAWICLGQELAQTVSLFQWVLRLPDVTPEFREQILDTTLAVLAATVAVLAVFYLLFPAIQIAQILRPALFAWCEILFVAASATSKCFLVAVASVLGQRPASTASSRGAKLQALQALRQRKEKEKHL